MRNWSMRTLNWTNNRLKRSLDESVRITRPGPQPAPRGLKPTNSQSQASSETTDSEKIRLIRQLLDTQDRLTVAEQVTAATQRRQLVQEGLYENLPTTGIYEKLRFDPTQGHVYTAFQLTKHTGWQIVFGIAVCCVKSLPWVSDAHTHGYTLSSSLSLICNLLHVSRTFTDVYSWFSLEVFKSRPISGKACSGD